jgi:hypothetical protein
VPPFRLPGSGSLPNVSQDSCRSAEQAGPNALVARLDLPALASPLTVTHPTPTKDPGLPDSDKLNAAPPTIPHAAAIPSDPGLPAAGRGPGCPGGVDDAAATA